MQFVDWTILATYAGAVAMVELLTQVTKDIEGINNIPTQIWSYILSVVTLYCAYYFTGNLDTSNAVLILFNGFLVSVASNGVYDGIKRFK